MKAKLLSLIIISILMIGLGAASSISVSEVDYLENTNEFYGEDHVIIEFQLDGTGEDIRATVPASDLSSTTDRTTDKDAEISVDLIDTFAEYRVDDRNLPRIEDIEYVRQSFSSADDRDSFVSTWCRDYSEDGTPDNYKWEKGWFFTDYWVTCGTSGSSSTSTYNVGYLQSPPDTMFEAEWTVNVDGESPESAVINNQGIGAGSQERISDNVQIDFLGMRDLGSQAPNPQNTLAAYSSSSGWKLINENDYQQYREYRQDVVPEKIEEFGTDPDAELNEDDWREENEAEYLIEYENAASVYTQSSISGATELGSTNIENGVFRYSSDSMFEWFVTDFAVRINGEFIGLEKEFGNPEIVGIESEPEVDGLAEDSVEIKVENTGSGVGFFEPIVDVGEGFELVGTSSGKSFNPGETKSLYATLDADGSESLTADNTFYVEDAETGETDSTVFTASFDPAEECNPGTQDVIVNADGQEQIVECAENGVDYIEIETCSSDETATLTSGSYECVEDEDPAVTDGEENCIIELGSFAGQTYTMTDPICVVQNWMSDTWESFSFGVGLAVTLLDVLFAIGAGLVGWIVGNKYVSRALEVSEATDRNDLKLLVSTGLALMTAVIAYSLFSQWWVKLLILIVLAVIIYLVAPLVSASGLAGALGAKEALNR